jgi:CubicO group peptidase (beta-lactamase class C family)
MRFAVAIGQVLREGSAPPMRRFHLPSRARPAAPSVLAQAALLPAVLALLASCGQDAPPPEPPLPQAARDAVAVDPGVPPELLARAVDDLFSKPGLGETRALVLLHDGKIVAERYADGFTADMPLIGWSMSKSVTAVLIGMLVADGRLALDDPAPVPQWQRAGDPRGEITLRHLLQMRSGLRHKEKADPLYSSAEVRMMFLDGRSDMAAWAEAQPLEHEPGTTFTYSTPTSVILADIASDAIAPGAAPDARQQAVAAFLEERLAGPLGMPSMRGEYDAAGTLIGGSAIWATARDWGRFGEFLRLGGSVDGAQIVPRGWITFMTGENPAVADYGAQIWHNRPSGGERDVLFAERGPADAFAAIGHLGQYVIVSPQQRLTLVRLGQTNEDARTALVAELADIVALYPSR